MQPLEVATRENASNLLDAVIHMQKKSASKAVLRRLQLSLHATRPTPHGASRLEQAMSPWSVKTGRAASRHSGDGRVYGHTTTVMHDGERTPPSAAAP